MSASFFRTDHTAQALNLPGPTVHAEATAQGSCLFDFALRHVLRLEATVFVALLPHNVFQVLSVPVLALFGVFSGA